MTPNFKVFLVGLLAAAALAFAAAAFAFERNGNVITMTQAEADACAAQNGCALITRDQLINALNRVHERALRQAQMECPSRTML